MLLEKNVETNLINPQESEPNTQSVTIPYFLYEAMARAYYGNRANSDLPVPEPPSRKENLNLEGVYFNGLDVPSNWKPGGVAAKDPRHVTPEVQTSQEEG